MNTSPIEEIKSLIRAHVPIIWVRTHEEDRFLSDFIQEIARPLSIDLYLWSAWQGLVPASGYDPDKVKQSSLTTQPTASKALEYFGGIKNKNQITVVVMKDLHVVLQPLEVRMLRDLYRHLANNNKNVIIVSPELAHGPGGSKEGIPSTLEKQVRVIDYTLPTHDDIVTFIRGSITSMNDSVKATNRKAQSKLKYTDEEYDEMGRALRGLTITEVTDAFATCLKAHKKLDPEILLQSKRQIVNKSNVLEFMDTDENINNVGGLDLLKEYLVRYKNSWSQEAKAFGVEPLRFVIMTGIAGTGKSLIAKCASTLYKLPLLKFDVGRVFGGVVGASEANMRSAISTMISVSPCVVLLDEMEKALSGNKSSGHSDGGTTSRVFGTLLTAIQEDLRECLILATANDISMLPPELLRRANEIFFVGFPSPAARWEIFDIHLRKRGRNIKNFEKYKDELLSSSDKFTGAEIEKAIIDAIARAFYDKSKDVEAKHILAALNETKPISTVMETEISTLEEWAKGHARFASSEEKEKVINSNISGRLRNLN